MDFSQFVNVIAQEATRGGMRTTSKMQRPGDIAANLRARERRGKRRGNRGSGQLSAEDLISLFQSMPTPNRGFRRPGGDKPDFLGGGLDEFYAKNPHIAQGPARAEQIAQERQQQLSRGFDAGRAAVDFAKQTKGYTDAQGNFVPPTMPATPSSNFGTGSVTFLPPGQKSRGTMTDPLTGKQVFMDEYLPQLEDVQNTKYGAMTKDVVDPVTGETKSYNDAGMDYFNPKGVSAQAAPSPSTGNTLMTQMPKQPQNDMAALFPGPSAAPVQAQVQPTFQPGLPMDTPGAASEMARKSSRFLPQGQVAPTQASAPASLSWFDQKVAANPDGIFSKLAEVGDMMPELPQVSSLSQNGVIPDLWDSGNAFLMGLGDLYSNNVGRPLDRLLFGIQPPAQPSNNMQQYQKSRGQKQGWW